MNSPVRRATILRAELLYKHPSGVYAGPNVEWVPDAFFVDSRNTLATDAYALLGAKLGFDNGGTWTAYIEGRNLTDEVYIASASVTTQAQSTALCSSLEPAAPFTAVFNIAGDDEKAGAVR